MKNIKKFLFVMVAAVTTEMVELWLYTKAQIHIRMELRLLHSLAIKAGERDGETIVKPLKHYLWERMRETPQKTERSQ